MNAHQTSKRNSSQRKNSERGSLTLLFCGLMAVLIGFFSAGFVVGGRVSQALKSQLAADESSRAMASQGAQGLNMISTNNLAVGSAMHVHNSILAIAHYAGFLVAASYSFPGGVVDAVNEQVGDPGADKIQTIVFDNAAKIASFMIATAAGASSFNKFLRDNWMFSAPAKGVEFGLLNSPGTLTLPFQETGTRNKDGKLPELVPFSPMKYEIAKDDLLPVSSAKSLLCMVTGVEPTTPEGKVDDANQHVAFRMAFGPIRSLDSDNEGPFGGAVNFLTGQLNKIINIVPVRFGFANCGIALKTSLFKIFSGAVDMVVSLSKNPNDAKKAADLVGKADSGVKYLEVVWDGLVEFGKTKLDSDPKFCRMGGMPILGCDLVGKIADVVDALEKSLEVLNAGGEQFRSRNLQDLYEKHEEEKQTYKRNKQAGKPTGPAPEENLRIPYSTKKSSECKKDKAGNLPEGCLKYVTIEKYSYLCPYYKNLKNSVVATCEKVDYVKEGKNKDSLGRVTDKIVPKLSGKDCTKEYKVEFRKTCGEYEEWEAPENQETTLMLTDFGCQAESYVKGKPQCGIFSKGLSDYVATAGAAEKPNDQLGFMVIRKDPKSLKRFQERQNYISLLVSPWLTSKESENILKKCENWQVDSAFTEGNKVCRVEAQALLAGARQPLPTPAPETLIVTPTPLAGAATPSLQQIQEAAARQESLQRAAQHRAAEWNVYSGGTEDTGLEKREQDSELEFLKRVGLSLSSSQVVHWPSSEDPAEMKPHLRTMWPSWTAAQGAVGYGTILGDGSVSELLDNLSGLSRD